MANDNQQEKVGETLQEMVADVAMKIMTCIPQGVPLHIVWAGLATAHTQMLLQTNQTAQQAEELLLYHGGVTRMTFYQNIMEAQQQANAATKQ